MTFRRFIQIFGHLCHWAAVLIMTVVFMQAAGIIQQPWLGDLLRDKPLVVWGPIGSLFLFDLFVRPPIRYRLMDPEVRAALDRIPLSRLVGRSTGLLFLEIVAMLAVMIVGGVCLVYSIIDLLNEPPGPGFKQSNAWCFFCGEVLFFLGVNSLRSYIYPPV
jgi:hypothetical protein